MVREGLKIGPWISMIIKSNFYQNLTYQYYLEMRIIGMIEAV